MSATGAGEAGDTLIRRLRTVRDRWPERVAVESGQTRLTYAELGDTIERVAAHLWREVGVRPGGRVALCLDPGLELVVALLAVARCGAAYVPLDVQNPVERKQLILGDCEPGVIVGDVTLAGPSTKTVPVETISGLIAGGAAPTDPVPDAVGGPDDVYLVMYTSGTTGRPKGVPLRQRNVLALFDAAQGLFRFGPDDVWTLYASIAFDLSVWEMWGALLHGGRVIVVDRWTKLSPAEYIGLLADRGVTVLCQTPTGFSILIDTLLQRVVEGRRPNLRYLIFGGERLPMALLRNWARQVGLDRPQLVNMYGITETTVHTTRHVVTAADLAQDHSVIGRPLPGHHIRVLDEEGRGATRGELYLAGPQVSDGYLNRPELTAQRFIPDPLGLLPDVTFYRTGDIVELDGDLLRYIGRADRQVKIRGHRVELGEVEAAVRVQPDIASACVLLLGIGSDQQALACGYTTHSGDPVPVRTLRAGLRDRVAQYMLPERFQWFAKMPLTVNGKTDVDALRKEMEQTA